VAMWVEGEGHQVTIPWKSSIKRNEWKFRL